MKINAKTSIGALFVLGFGSALVAGGALAQTSGPVAWRPDGLMLSEALSPLPQFIQQDLGRGPRGWRMNRDEDAGQDHDDDHDAGRGGGPTAGRQGSQGGPGGMRPDMMRPPMMGQGMMAMGGARFHMRRGDAEIDVRCPADVRMSDCVEAIGKMIDRLGALGSGVPR
jgi:hypothetical protein